MVASAALIGSAWLSNAGTAASSDVAIRTVGPSDARLLASEVDANCEDEAHVIPALYAWNPDVRVVYFRHVSRWM